MTMPATRITAFITRALGINGGGVFPSETRRTDAPPQVFSSKTSVIDT